MAISAQAQNVARSGFSDAVERMFRSYSLALEQYDLSGLIQHYQFPLLVQHLGETRSFEHPHEFEDRLQELFQIYRTKQFATAPYQIIDIHTLGQDCGVVSVHWQHKNIMGQVMSDFICHYYVLMADKQTKILLIHNPCPFVEEFPLTSKSY